MGCSAVAASAGPARRCEERSAVIDTIEVTVGTDALLLVFRCTVGVIMFMHGWNHLFGAGGVEGTARWFGGLGFRPARFHALVSGWMELAVGVGLVVGLLTAPACAAVVGVMAVAGWTHHRPNGFFIFREGYEYVLALAVAAVVLASLGPGLWSLDYVFGVVDYTSGSGAGLRGDLGLTIAAAGGLLGAVGLLVTGWRPSSVEKPAG